MAPLHKENCDLLVHHAVMLTVAAALCRLAVAAGAWCGIAAAISATEIKPNGDLVADHLLNSRWIAPQRPSDNAAGMQHQEGGQLADRRRPAAVRRQAPPPSDDRVGRSASVGGARLSSAVDSLAGLFSQRQPIHPIIEWPAVTTSWGYGPRPTTKPPPPAPHVVCGGRKLLMGQCKCSFGTWKKPGLIRKSGYSCKHKCAKGWVDEKKFFPKRFHRCLAPFLSKIFVPMMAEACTKRDDAYCMCGAPRKKAEVQFKKDMLVLCAQAPQGKVWCKRNARREWRSAVKKRRSQFEKEQQKACACLTPSR
mmetsp:Transcript_18575/g.36445  ORF Transcript_18575/g.36445 Transcript_18575/m.36445 type:complete len:308 (+) Transcript_18575:2-925(+)